MTTGLLIGASVIILYFLIGVVVDCLDNYHTHRELDEPLDWFTILAWPLLLLGEMGD